MAVASVQTTWASCTPSVPPLAARPPSLTMSQMRSRPHGASISRGAASSSRHAFATAGQCQSAQIGK
eukprot:12825129-Alexandrium_andersonii.AAC.1